MAFHDPEKFPREACGLFGIFGVPNAAPLIYQGLFSLQHRGQEGAGIVTSDGRRVHVPLPQTGFVDVVVLPLLRSLLLGLDGLLGLITGSRQENGGSRR